jgi:hypothetical protein
VDRLLASPRYGERWARRWLDLARYADTNGYEKDRDRSIWPYRDWVIRALNADMPFEQFTIDQIAGDLLPDATIDQRTATGFHRNTMINEEGGIDVEEFRFAALVDRVATMGTTWLGLTIGCAQCHAHKYDPIGQREYYRLMAMMNNADEPDLELHDARIDAERAGALAKISAIESDLARRFPLDPNEGWVALEPVAARSDGDVTLEVLGDRSVRAAGDAPETATYELELAADAFTIDRLRIEALTDASLPATGPGRAPNGNFVLTRVVVETESRDGGERVPIEIGSAEAEFAQSGFDPKGLLDDDPRTGWAVDDGTGRLNRRRAVDLKLKEPAPESGEGMRTLRLAIEQLHGGKHTLGRFRVLARGPEASIPTLPEEERRRRYLASRFKEWTRSIEPVEWRIVRPGRLHSRKGASLDVLDDGSILASGDVPNNDVTEIDVPIESGTAPVTAIRLEALPHKSLPGGGPGRAPLFSVGDFIVTEIETRFEPEGGRGLGRLILLRNGTQDYSEAGKGADKAIDGVPETGWTIKGQTGRPHAAVFELVEPMAPGERGTLRLVVHQFGIHQMTLGRFRLSVTGQSHPVKASGVPEEIEAVLRVPSDERTKDHHRLVEDFYLRFAAMELETAHKEIETLRAKLPARPTTMVMAERPARHARTTRLYERGEFLKPRESVVPGVPAVLHPLPERGRSDRLRLATWLVANDNPLTARVVANRDWSALLGRGLVATVDDFGARGEKPTHPDLLDWLALELSERGWSRKALARTIVTSTTYRQSSAVSPGALARDARNELLGRGPRIRVEAEVVRDLALAAAGLLDQRLGGPSVYPPQPEGVTALAYSGGSWPTSNGPDRYRRGLYTFLKRTAPFAASITFDGPTSETSCARRDRSNTPLQALTLLNDAVFVEASQALARRVLNEMPRGPDSVRCERMFRLCLGRKPTEVELDRLESFLESCRSEIVDAGLDAGKLAGLEQFGSIDGVAAEELAAWAIVGRTLLNLDETITRE